MPEPLFRHESGGVVPSESAGSPWSRQSLHGGAVAALLAHGFEGAAREVGLRPVRLGVDLFRPVPAQPLSLRHRTVRRGRRLALLESELLAEGQPVARGSALLLDDGAPATAPGGPRPEAPEALESGRLYPAAIAERTPPGFHCHVDVRFCMYDGAPLMWVRPELELFSGVSLSPLVLAAACSDLVYAATVLPALRGQDSSWSLSGRLGKPYINADTTLYLERPPTGDWMAFQAQPLAVHGRTAVARVAVLDSNGRLGSAAQALLENPSGRRPER